MASAAADTSEYATEEKVYGFHGPMLYVAKVLKTQVDPATKKNKYFLHYDGWNNKWNEQVRGLRRWTPGQSRLDSSRRRPRDCHSGRSAPGGRAPSPCLTHR